MKVENRVLSLILSEHLLYMKILHCLYLSLRHYLYVHSLKLDFFFATCLVKHKIGITRHGIAENPLRWDQHHRKE
jgi:hypothetical protein